MSFANVWLGLRDDANTLALEYLHWDEESQGAYSGPVSARAGRLLRFFADADNVQKSYKAPTLGGNVWHLWTISFESQQYSLVQIREEIDWFAATYGAQTSIVGAWMWTGEQYGTEHVYTTTIEQQPVRRPNPDYQPIEEEPDYDPERWIYPIEDVEVTRITGYTGTPIYPIPAAQLLNFMPDVDGNPATFLADVNLLFGQAPRSFFV